MRLVSLYKEDPAELSCLFCRAGLQQEDGPRWRSMPSPGPDPAGGLISDSSASRAKRNKCLLFISHPVYGVSL